MLRSANLAIGIVTFAILAVVLYGGIGAFMGFGYFGDGLTRQFSWLGTVWWLVALVWLVVWFVGLGVSVVNARALWSRIRSRINEPWVLTDITLVLGHAATVTALILLFASWPWGDFMYLSLMVAGFFYAGGVAVFALTSRSRPTQ
jgi:hypothetical protein